MISGFGSGFAPSAGISPLIEPRDLQDETFKGCDLFFALQKAECKQNYKGLAGNFDFTPITYERCYEFMTTTFYSQFGCVDPDGQWDIDMDDYFVLTKKYYGFDQDDYYYVDFQYIYKEVEWESLNDFYEGIDDAFGNVNSVYRKQQGRVYTSTWDGLMPGEKQETFKD